MSAKVTSAGQAQLRSAKLSNAEIGRRIGASKVLVGRWANGRNKPRPAAREALATLLGIDPASWEPAPPKVSKSGKRPKTEPKRSKAQPAEPAEPEDLLTSIRELRRAAEAEGAWATAIKLANQELKAIKDQLLRLSPERLQASHPGMWRTHRHLVDALAPWPALVDAIDQVGADLLEPPPSSEDPIDPIPADGWSIPCLVESAFNRAVELRTTVAKTGASDLRAAACELERRAGALLSVLERRSAKLERQLSVRPSRYYPGLAVQAIAESVNALSESERAAAVAVVCGAFEVEPGAQDRSPKQWPDTARAQVNADVAAWNTRQGFTDEAIAAREQRAYRLDARGLRVYPRSAVESEMAFDAYLSGVA